MLSLIFLSSSPFASKTIELHQATLLDLKNFKLLDATPNTRALSRVAIPENALQRISETAQDKQSIARYQQLFKGIPVIGAQITVTHGAGDLVNGQLVDSLQINSNPALSQSEATQLAKKAYLATNANAVIHDETSQLQIRLNEAGEPSLAYLVTFKSMKNNRPVWLFFVIDAQTGAVSKRWNNIKTYLDSGPGGNEKVHEYWYGKDGLPHLNVEQSGMLCRLQSSKVRLVDVKSTWDWNNDLRNPLQYVCANNTEENVNGAFSPRNDAYYFGHLIVDMYRNWYKVNALQLATGEAMQLIMRVHFGQYYDNAFWDGQSMSFGDGYELYPLVSLDVAGHEVTHGFTEQHSGLEYHDESGALNESISDMGGQAARAYLLETSPALYNRAYLTPNKMTWGIGETIMRGKDTAIRFMDSPSSDGNSADCLDESLAKAHGASCDISYLDVVNFAEQRISDPEEQQSVIVHSASGIFNKAYYLLSNQIGVKSAYQVMVLANIKYWKPDTTFLSAACGVLHAAEDLHMDSKPFKSAFDQVGVSTVSCLS